jgi:hypothetical protein
MIDSSQSNKPWGPKGSRPQLPVFGIDNTNCTCKQSETNSKKLCMPCSSKMLCTYPLSEKRISQDFALAIAVVSVSCAPIQHISCGCNHEAASVTRSAASTQVPIQLQRRRAQTKPKQNKCRPNQCDGWRGQEALNRTWSPHAWSHHNSESMRLHLLIKEHVCLPIKDRPRRDIGNAGVIKLKPFPMALLHLCNVMPFCWALPCKCAFC